MPNEHDLTATRFAGDPTLEAVFDGEELLQEGDSGPAVETLQQALVDAGFELPNQGVSGYFNTETFTAVVDFQEHSGIQGPGLDGKVGPVTMGWLDQRFSDGPTPPGFGGPFATPGCSEIKKVSVDVVSLAGATRDPITDLAIANTIFNQSCIRFVAQQMVQVPTIVTKAWLAGDTKIATNGVLSCAPTAEEVTAYDGAGTEFGLGSRIRIFYVEDIVPPSGQLPGYSFIRACKSHTNEMVVISNALGHPTLGERLLAHELGHVLLNVDNGGHSNDLTNLMADDAVDGHGTNLTPAQRTTIHANA